MTAVVMLAPSLSWPVFLVALLFTVIGVLAVLKDRARRIVAALLLACVLSAPAIVHASDPEAVIGKGVCDLMPWLIECWCPWCL